jgi:hypothetical protein
MARGVVIPAEGGVAKIADPGVVYMTRVGSLKMTDWGRLQCRFTPPATPGRNLSSLASLTVPSSASWAPLGSNDAQPTFSDVHIEVQKMCLGSTESHLS